jgi:bifunctional UDP-N-acetylglucosamine pyrophosphorylase/glucosamine-1-phosphate N-acetyltransferase
VPTTARKTAGRSLAVVVLAAGKGKRIKSKLPKVLHPLAGRPVLWHVLDAAARLKPSKIVVVTGHRAEDVAAAVKAWGITPTPVFVDQGEPLGTGHAVMVTEKAVGRATDVLTLAGDDPLVTTAQIRQLLTLHRRSQAAGSILTTDVDDPTGYGRVVRVGKELVAIVQEADADAATRAIREISTLVYAFRRKDLFGVLPMVGRENRQNEYYLPDVLPILKDKGEKVVVHKADLGGGLGVNSRGGLAAAARIMRERINAVHMANGVTLVDPDQTYIDVGVRIGQDTTIWPMTILQGDTRIGEGATIGPATRIVDSTVGDGSTVQFSVVLQSKIARDVSVGPYAYLRPGADLADSSKAGTFVEIKGSTVGPGSKVPHLAYIGDATIGRDSNIGAGTITCNYDGWDKHETFIGDEVKIGSDTMLVAPVRVGDRAMTAAGSAITLDVPEGALGIERAEQRNVEGYRERKEASKRASGRSKSKN